MRWSYDLTNAPEIVRDIPVYDAALLTNGELLMLGASANNTADGGISAVTAYSDTSANTALNAIGILKESTYESGGTVPDEVIGDTTYGVRLGKVIINPFAVYMAEVDNSTGDDLAVESSSTTTTIYESLSNIGAHGLDGYWVLFKNCSTSGLDNCLRMITANGTATFTIPALPATPTTSDDYIFANPNHAYASNLNAEATKLSGNQGTNKTIDYPEGATNLRVVQSYCEGDGYPTLTPLRTYFVPGASVNIGGNGALYSEIMMKDHVYGVQES